MQNNAKPWDDRYSSKEFYYGIEPNDFLKEQASKISIKGNVLCLAEGEGRNAVYLAKLGFEVTAVDQSSEGLKKLSALAKLNQVNVKTVVADLADFKILENQWDAIVSIWCHVPPELRRTLHSNVVHGLKNRGVFILESYHPKQLEFKTGGPPSAELMMTKSSLESELKGLHFECLHELNRDIQEGKGHSGMSAVAQVLAIKLD